MKKVAKMAEGFAKNGVLSPVFEVSVLPSIPTLQKLAHTSWTVVTSNIMKISSTVTLRSGVISDCAASGLLQLQWQEETSKYHNAIMTFAIICKMMC